MVGRGQMRPEEVEKIIDKRDRKGAGPTAPAKGLTLKVIEYE